MADKPKKPQKLRARLPRGLADRGPAEIAATRRMTETIRGVFELYGFEPVETPAMEFTDALGKFLPDQDRPNEGVFSFQDDDEQWISLRYDLTAPLARYVAERYGTEHLVLPYRSYRQGWVFRNEKPGPGRFRQFMQFDADTVGAASPAADAEMCMMAADTMEALGIPRGSYVVKVSSRKVLDGLLDVMGLGGEHNEAIRLTVLRAVDKFDRLGGQGVRELLGLGRKDESGDFTKGAGLSAEQSNFLVSLLENKLDSSRTLLEVDGSSVVAKVVYSVRHDGVRLIEDHDPITTHNNILILDYLSALAPDNGILQDAIEDLQRIANLAHTCGYDATQILIDPSVVRGLEYYTGPVFEIELTFPIEDEAGKKIRFGSVGGGGRYDGLVGRFRGEKVPATGFSIGVSRLMAALQAVKSPLVTSKEIFGPVVVTVFDKDQISDCQKIVNQLRNAGIRAELYLGSGRMGPQLKYADKRNSPCVIIQGSDERTRGEVQIKDLIEGAKAAAAIASNQEWRESRPAQFSCREDEVVAKVREVLARHDVTWK
jgi:histidyl-tRNA synthetase